jgi:PAS domain-containing protein
VSASNQAVQVTLLGDAAEHAEVGVLVWNADRRYVAANPRAAELVGTTRDRLLDQPVGSTNRSPEAQEAIEAVIRHVPARGSMRLGDRDIDWVVFPTTVAGLEHVIGLFWEAEYP